MSLEVQIVSPERVLFDGTASAVIARTAGGGDIAFYTGHAPFIGALDTWTVEVRVEDGPDVTMAVHGGFAEVSNSRITILSDVAELSDQIDVARAQRAKEAAEAAVKADAGDATAREALKRAEARLRAAQGPVAASH